MVKRVTGFALACVWLSACAQVAKLDRFEFVDDPCASQAQEITCKGKACGTATDNCGQTVLCKDTCVAPQSCGGGDAGANQCGCTAQEMATTCKGIPCGPAMDNCGKMITCPDVCAPPLVCGGGGVGPNACGCTPEPKATSCKSKQCGKTKNNCGLEVACDGTCPTLYACENGGAAANTCGCTGGTMTTPVAPADCTAFAGTQASGTEGHTYYVCGKLEYTKARAFCQAFGTDLVRIGSAAENAFVQNMFPFGVNAFLGLEDPNGCPGGSDGVPCKFKWIDLTDISYTSWDPGEPNNSQGIEQCVEMRKSNGQWNDVPCGNPLRVVCETTCP
jgi:hypothetical protein